MWSVDDDATQELMTNFYEEWLSTGNKHQSFITAQKRLKESRSAPYYWGAFIMVGN
jgi:CHAT domain-containing protein